MFCRYILSLISKVMSYLNEISSANLSRLKLQYDYVFHELEDLMEKYSTGAETDQESSDSSSSEFTNENSLSSKAKTLFYLEYLILEKTSKHIFHKYLL